MESVEATEPRSPAYWVNYLKERGINVSERTLRTKAREYGLFCALGQTMMINFNQMDEIIKKEAQHQRLEK